MAMWVIAVVDDAPCQCFSLGANQTTSPGRIFLGSARTLSPAKSGRHDQRLTERMCVPGSARTRLERNACTSNTRRLRSFK